MAATLSMNMNEHALMPSSWFADVKLLREKHRFIGALIGPNTGNTHQEHLPHSLPLLLLPEELHLGLKRGNL
jgi:hypothetical protein